MSQNVKNQLVALYGRVSSERQEREGTIDSQIEEVEKAVAANGDVCVKKYVDDGYSGELLERPALDQLRNDAKKKLFSKVYILSPDRLARKHHYAAIIMEDLARYGIDIVFVNRPIGESIEDKLLFNVQSVIAEYEKAKILDRMRRGKLYKIKQGNVLGNIAPYGYRYVKDEKSRRGWYEIDEKEAETVRLIYSIYLGVDCSGLCTLRRELYNRNILTRSGSKNWGTSTVARIISDETYIGTTHWGKCKSVEGDPDGSYHRLKNTKRVRREKSEWLAIPVPPIIEVATFRKAEVKRATNKSLSPETARNEYLLRGIMVHSCGARMYSKHCHSQKYYICSAKRQAFPAKSECASSRHYNGCDLEEIVWGEFLKTIQSPAMLMRRIGQKVSDRGIDKEALESQIGEIDKVVLREEEKKNRLLAAYSEGIFSLEELKEQKDKIQHLIDLKNQERQTLSKKLDVDCGDSPKEINIKDFAHKIAALVQKPDFRKKQKILRYFIDRITLDGNTARINAFLPKELFVAPTFTLS